MQLLSSSREYFAAVSADNRLKVWDVASGALVHELKERDHLSYKYTCIAWSERTKAKKKTSKRAKNASMGVIALGTSTGVIVLWDLQQAQVAQRLSVDNDKDAHGAAVLDVAFNQQGNLLYSCSSEKSVLEWDIGNGKVARKFRVGSDGAEKLVVSPDDEVLAVGGTSLRTFDLVSGKKSRKFVAGISSKVNQLVFSSCKRFLFSSTVSGRFVNLYDMEADEDEPVMNFSMPSSSTSLFARTDTQKKKTDVLLGAVSAVGDVYLWACKYKTGTQSTKPVVPSSKSIVKAPTADEATASSNVLEAVESPNDDSSLLVVRGSTVKPLFETVAIRDEQNALVEEIVFNPLSQHLLLAASANEDAQRKKQKVGAESTPEEEKTRVPTLAERSGKANGGDVVDMSAPSFEELDEAGEENEPSLAERVEALRERVESDLAAELVRVENEQDQPQDKPDASSLSSVLEQALQTKDNAMLEYCLRTNDSKVINNTIKRVSSVKVLELLEILVIKFEKSPGRCARLCPWIRSILLHHTAYLMAQPNLVQSLSSLYQILENRLKVHPQLQMLAGRLSLVIGQINEASTSGVGEGDASSDSHRAKIVYREGEEGDEEDGEGKQNGVAVEMDEEEEDASEEEEEEEMDDDE